jgi:hypothetical protein
LDYLTTVFQLLWITGVKRDEVTREWRRLLNEELHNLHFSLNIIRVIKSRRMRYAGYVAHMEDRRDAYRVLVGKPEGKRPLGRLRCRWEDNIKMDLQEVGWGWHGLNSSGSGEGQVVGSSECDNEPSGSIKYGESLDRLRTCQLLKKDSAPESLMVMLCHTVGWL